MNRRWPYGPLAGVIVLGFLVVLTGTGYAADDGPTTAESPKTQVQPAPAAPKSAFGYAQVVEKARKRAQTPYKAPTQIPKFLQDISTNTLGQIRYKRDQALWHNRNLPFEVMFHHPGSYYIYPVAINLVAGGEVTPFVFDRNRFNYPTEKLKERVPQDLGYAGFKLLHELGTPDKKDEVVSFLGASYFRALGADAHYGLSARGLAIDTGSNDGEEFPAFTDFWLVAPDKESESQTLYALLDSPSTTGAYRFVIDPGETTVSHVEMTLFTRRPIAKLGVAPLTSMFMWGENSLSRLDDYRPEAHDSDGLLISAANGEWLWRPLVNPHRLWMNQFVANNVRGFGLIQRDRKFDHYQDLDYQYQRRPSAWVVPEGDWGNGHLELVQIPSDSEVNDNIVLYWVPEKAVTAGQRLHFRYDIRWSNQDPSPATFGHAVASRIGRATVVPGEPRNTLRVAIEFVGGELADLTDPDKVQPRVNAMRDATINNIQAVRNPHTNGWRLTFLVPTEALDAPLELRAYLEGANGGALTETWTYAVTP